MARANQHVPRAWISCVSTSCTRGHFDGLLLTKAKVQQLNSADQPGAIGKNTTGQSMSQLFERGARSKQLARCDETVHKVIVAKNLPTGRLTDPQRVVAVLGAARTACLLSCLNPVFCLHPPDRYRPLPLLEPRAPRSVQI